MQDIYYHRPRGLSTVFAKKFKIFFAKQKKVLLPPSGGGRRSLFSAADGLLARAALRPGVPLRALWWLCAVCGVPCTLRYPLHAPRVAPVRPEVSLRALRCPARSGVSCALCGAPCALRCPPCALGCPPCALRCPLRALRCPARSGMPHAPCVAPRAPWDAPRALWDAPVRSAVPPCALGCPLPALGVSCVLFSVLCTPLRCSAGLRQHCGASRPAIQSASLPRPAAVLSPAPPHGREKARPLQKERPGLVHFAVRR